MAPTVIGRKSLGSIRTAGVSAPQSMPSVSGSRLQWGVCRRPSGVLRGEGFGESGRRRLLLGSALGQSYWLRQIRKPRHASPPSRNIWISSGLRGRASGLREFAAFARLDLFGIPWILSSETSLFNGLQATRAEFYFKWPPPPPHAPQAPERWPRQHPRRAERDHGIRHREGPIGHWDQTTAALPFFATNCRRDIILRKSS